MEFFTYILSNGIRCIYKRIKSPVAYCAMTINSGSRDETEKEFGIAHFTEHSLFKGTAKRRAYHINNRLEKLGGELNAFTTKEETVVHATTLKSDLPKAAELISDIVFNSIFPQKEIDKEREVIIDEINSYKDSPPDRIYDEFEDMLFAGSQLGHNILGTRTSVNRISGHDIHEYTARCFNTDQMVFSVAANITETAFIRLAESYFGDSPISVRVFGRNAPAEIQPFSNSVNRGTHQAHCILGNRAYSFHSSQRTALSLLVNALGGPAANSLLNSLLREKHGLTYNIEASYTPYSDTGIASIYFGTDKDKVDRCLEIIYKLLARIKSTSMNGRHLSMAKKQFIGQLSISMESQEGYMLGAAKSYLVYNEIDTPQVMYKKILGITSSEIMAAANEVFDKTSLLVYNGKQKH